MGARRICNAVVGVRIPCGPPVYKKLPKVVRDAIDDQISWLKTYCVMADKHSFDEKSKKDALRKLDKLIAFKKLP